MDPEKEATMAITLTSSAFSEGTRIPKRHAGDGDNRSPGLSWAGAPEAAKSFALIMDDPDAPAGTFIHWVLFNVPPDSAGLPEGVPVKAEVHGIGRQGMNDARTNGYYGPCPPPGKPHRYTLKFFALDKLLDLNPGSAADQLRHAMQDCTLDTGSLTGSYHR
jgi:Raf kinase inhibitor-like YbhB/YbcL family protein